MDDLIILAVAASVAMWLMSHKPEHWADRAPEGLCRTANLYKPDPEWGACLEADFR